MNNKQTIFTIGVILVAIFIVVFTTRTKTFYGETVFLTTRIDEKITIEGADTVFVTAASDSYFRIYSGAERLLAVPNDGLENFSAVNRSFPAQNWQIKDGLGIDLIIVSDHLLVITQEPSPSFVFGIIYVMVLAALFFGAIGNAMLSDR